MASLYIGITTYVFVVIFPPNFANTSFYQIAHVRHTSCLRPDGNRQRQVILGPIAPSSPEASAARNTSMARRGTMPTRTAARVAGELRFWGNERNITFFPPQHTHPSFCLPHHLGPPRNLTARSATRAHVEHRKRPSGDSRGFDSTGPYTNESCCRTHGDHCHIQRSTCRGRGNSRQTPVARH